MHHNHCHSSNSMASGPDNTTSIGRLRNRGWREPGSKTARNMARIGAKLCQNAFRTIPDVSFFDAEKIFSAKFLNQKFRFSLIWRGFGAATAERTSKSACSSNFALERLIQRSVRPKNLRFGLIPAGNFNPNELNPGPVDGRSMFAQFLRERWPYIATLSTKSVFEPDFLNLLNGRHNGNETTENLQKQTCTLYRK